ncbi:putative ribosomal protein S25 [Chiua virens]|nr:putative ribosomal protein S25 [Chiua virens]
MAKAKTPAPSSSGGKAAKKKKWSKGKVKDKAQHAVICDKTTYDRVMKEVPTWRFISQSILIERLKVNGSLARIVIRPSREGRLDQAHRAPLWPAHLQLVLYYLSSKPDILLRTIQSQPV